MKKYLIIAIVLLSKSTFGQNIQKIDSLTFAMCKSLESFQNIDNVIKVKTMFEKHIPDFYREVGVATKEDADSINDKIYYRLQRNCKQFREILSSLEINKSDWKSLKEKPLSKVTKNDFNQFLINKNYYYKEHDGAIVNVLINDNIWQETFEDGTISKLTLLPKKEGEFDLEFTESNNEMRKNFSVKGDVYNYGIYLKEGDDYLIWVKAQDNSFASFKVYKKANR